MEWALQQGNPPPPKKRRDELDNVAMNIKFKRENNMW